MKNIFGDRAFQVIAMPNNPRHRIAALLRF
jgi:hypothetical protein